MEISPDHIVYFSYGFIKLNATILYTWLVMGGIVLFSWIVTRKVTSSSVISNRQNLLEVLVDGLLVQIKDATNQQPERFLPLLGTLFIFILVSNVLSAVPGFKPPTGSLSTTTAFSLIVFFAVPYYGIKENGVLNYLKSYIRPSPYMIVFNIIGEVTRTFALAVRLFGNMLSGTMMGAVLLVVMPLFIPVIMQILGLLISVVQAYIFVVLAAVFIAAGLEVHSETGSK